MTRAKALLVGTLATAWLAVPVPLDAQRPLPTFRSGVDMVSVSVSVRDHKGHTPGNLTRADFVVLDSGRARVVDQARLEPDGPVRVALVLDTSGSMGLARTWTMAREIVGRVAALLDDRRDDVALFAFDSRLRLVRAFSRRSVPFLPLLDEMAPFGRTSLYDSMAASLDRLQGPGEDPRALLVVTDGMDTSSRELPGETGASMTAVAARSYVFVTQTPMEARDASRARRPGLTALADLARRTGGDLFPVSAPSHATAAAERVVRDLRHRYVIAFEASVEPGWHPVEVRARNPRLDVRTQGGYHVHGPATR